MIFRKKEKAQNSTLDNLILGLINQAYAKMKDNEFSSTKSLLYQAHIIYGYRGYNFGIECEVNKAVLQLMEKYP